MTKGSWRPQQKTIIAIVTIITFAVGVHEGGAAVDGAGRVFSGRHQNRRLFAVLPLLLLVGARRRATDETEDDDEDDDDDGADGSGDDGDDRLQIEDGRIGRHVSVSQNRVHDLLITVQAGHHAV